LLKIALDSLGASGPHGLSEISLRVCLERFRQRFGVRRLTATRRGTLAMFLGRFAHAISILAITGSLARKKKTAPSPGTCRRTARFSSFFFSVSLRS
jgi:K+-transporting ATPase ATPase A chain